jgi:hypothetical protein
MLLRQHIYMYGQDIHKLEIFYGPGFDRAKGQPELLVHQEVLIGFGYI